MFSFCAIDSRYVRIVIFQLSGLNGAKLLTLRANNRLKDFVQILSLSQKETIYKKVLNELTYPLLAVFHTFSTMFFLLNERRLKKDKNLTTSALIADKFVNSVLQQLARVS